MKESQVPQPLLLSNKESDKRISLKTATYRSQQLNGKKYSPTYAEHLNNRITNQLKKIVPQDLGHKSTKQLCLNKQVSSKRLHTISNPGYIQQYQNFNITINPELAEKLYKLNQKVNLIEFNNKKLRSQSGKIPSRQIFSIANHYFRIMKQQPPQSAIPVPNKQKSVIKQIRGVKNNIRQLKQMIKTIKQQKQGRAQSGIKTERLKSSKQLSQKRIRPMTTLKRGNQRIIIQKRQFFNEPVQKQVQKYKLHNNIEYQQHNESQSQRRTIYFKKNITASKNIQFDSVQTPEQIQFDFRQNNLTTRSNINYPEQRKNKKPSSLPRGLLQKQFQVSKSISQKKIQPHQNTKIINPSIFVYQKDTNQVQDIISNIQQNIDNQDLKRRMKILPKLPEGFNPLMNSEQLLEIAKQLFIKFNINSNYSTPINIKKYKNCVHFNHLDTNILWYYDGKFYIGGWKYDKQGYKQGYGIQSIPGKYVYEGQFHQGKRNGFGMMSSLNGQFYRGNWINGYRHGKGRQQSSLAGSIYQGDWMYGKKQGKGKLIFSKNQYFEGSFNNGLKNGLGKQKFKNGDTYQGQYLDGKFSGLGQYNWFNKSSYNGQFKDGKRHGKGTWIAGSNFQSQIYQGFYQNDKKSGKGRYKWPNGSMYIGYFSNDQKNGQGTLYYADGKITQALWQKDNIIKQLYSQKSKSKFKHNKL